MCRKQGLFCSAPSHIQGGACAHYRGGRPLDPADWLIRDDAFEAQVAFKVTLLKSPKKNDVLSRLPVSEMAEWEYCALVYAVLARKNARLTL